MSADTIPPAVRAPSRSCWAMATALSSRSRASSLGSFPWRSRSLTSMATVTATWSSLCPAAPMAPAPVTAESAFCSPMAMEPSSLSRSTSDWAATPRNSVSATSTAITTPTSSLSTTRPPTSRCSWATATAPCNPESLSRWAPIPFLWSSPTSTATKPPTWLSSPRFRTMSASCSTPDHKAPVPSLERRSFAASLSCRRKSVLLQADNGWSQETRNRMTSLWDARKGLFPWSGYQAPGTRLLPPHPTQHCGNYGIVKLPIHCEPVCHVIELHVARAAGMHLVHDPHDRLTVGPAHDVVARAANHQHRRGHALPHFSQVQRLELLIERRRAPILSIRRVVPEALPFRMLRDNLGGSHVLHQVEHVELDKCLHGAIYLRGRLAFLHQPPSLQVNHVLVPGTPPRPAGNKSPHRMVARRQWRKSAAVAQPDHKDALAVDEIVFRKGIESRLPARNLALEIGLRTVAFTLAHAGLVHARGRVTRFVNQSAQENSEAVGRIGIRILHAVATQPSDKKDRRHFACKVVGPRNERPQPFSPAVLHPVVENHCVFEVLARSRRLREHRHAERHHHHHFRKVGSLHKPLPRRIETQARSPG